LTWEITLSPMMSWEKWAISGTSPLIAENGYISPELREKWFQMIGFRNILVHDYAEIDHQIVYDVLQNQLPDFLALRAVFAQFL